MLAELREHADEELTHDKEWPRAANVLSARLRRLAPLLREAGQVNVREAPRSDKRGSKRWIITLMEREW
jgi:hypothetical protein